MPPLIHCRSTTSANTEEFVQSAGGVTRLSLGLTPLLECMGLQT
jgi:hypothetical protein